MTNLNNNQQNNLVSFLRGNCPLPPDADPDLEQRLFDSLEPRTTEGKNRLKAVWTIPSAIATGFLFTSVSFGLRTPRIAIEPKDFENFLVRNWQNTLENNGYSAIEETEAQWLLPVVTDPNSTLSVSAQ
ncbi:MAG: hypothetical protein AAGF83_08890 [Cyanobacteria bacterium P01_G01_bin.67]